MQAFMRELYDFVRQNARAIQGEDELKWLWGL